MRNIAHQVAVVAVASLAGCSALPEAERPATLRGGVLYDPSGDPLGPNSELPHKILDERGRTWLQMPDLTTCRGMQVETLILGDKVYIPESSPAPQL